MTSQEVEQRQAQQLVSLTIDGIPVSVPPGTLVIRAAEQVGVQIPRFCDHPLLEPVGACRQCLVDIPDAGNGRGFPKPQASCTIPVAEGMVVETANATATKAQHGIMEFLLVNHPLDCPVCDKGGECPLQNQAMSNGQGESRFSANGAGIKRTFPKPINLSPTILLDRERCIVCQRCTRFAAEIPGDPGISLIQRGAQQQIGIADGEPFDSYFSGNTIQICPVGALTSEEYRFRSRPFDLISTPGVGEHDACGAAIRVDHRRGKVMRRLSGNDPAVNEEWITDKDRFGFAYLYGDDRIAYPMIREDGTLRPASWLEAFTVAARGLAAAGAAAVLPGGRLTLADARAYAAFARETLGTEDVDFRARPLSAEETGFLREHVAGSGLGVTYDDLEAAPVVVLAGLEPEDEAGSIFLRLRKSVRHGGTKVVAVAPYTSRGSAKLSAELVRTAPGEEAAAIAALDLPEGAVILAGERLALSPGALPAVAATGARWAWVPRRAGDRGAVEAGLLPAEGGRDADEIVAATIAGEIGALVVGGVDPDDTADPAAFLAALEAAEFVVSLEVRRTAVTERADVVFPAAAITDKAGAFVNWEGRERAFPRVFKNPNALTETRILQEVTDEYRRVGRSVSSQDAESAEVLVHLVEDAGTSADSAVSEPALLPTRRFRLATWKLMLDNGVLQQGDKALAATARPAVARLSQRNLDEFGTTVTITGDRGSVTLPAEAADLADDVVWLPANSTGRGLLADLASPGSPVEVSRA
ncbi:NADH-quinone oxidoreductase subunit G [Nocardioides sp.]|uniref:NADH-quinone oxidoreductase subunit G n=1 Tax=Nocardioides sp. TaxID=35761 RepID=UPI0039E43D25